MNLNNNRYFIVSGVLSFSFFALIVIIIGWQAFILSNKVQKVDSFASTKSDVISISLVPSVSNEQFPVEEPLTSEPITKEIKDQIPQKSEVEPIIEAEQKTVQKTVQKLESKPKEVAVSDLFSTVKINNTPQKVKEEKKKLSELNALEEKILTSKRESKLFEKAKTVDLAKTGVKLVAAAGSRGPMVNEYNAKIQGIVYSNFHPSSGTEGFSARVRITLDPEGILLNYRVISYSGSSIFNTEVDWLKERLLHTKLPTHPNGEESVFEIILTAKE